MLVLGWVPCCGEKETQNLEWLSGFEDSKIAVLDIRLLRRCPLFAGISRDLVTE